MFEDSLMESGGKLKTKRGATTLLLVCFASCADWRPGVVAVDLHRGPAQAATDDVPGRAATASATSATTAAVAPVHITKPQTELDNGQLRTPTAIPKKIEMIKEDEPPPSTGVAGVVGGVPGGVPGGAMGGVLGSVIGNVPTAVPKAATPQRVRVSQGVSQGLLIHKVQPQYPPLARQARVQGTVVLQALIGKDGTIQNLHVVSGHPMLTASALEAVKQWRYKPYYLNGEPVEVETTINVNFTLSGG